MTCTSGVGGEKKCSQSRALIRSLEQDLNSPSCEIVSATPLQRGELWKSTENLQMARGTVALVNRELQAASKE
jgi:arsenate reductase-like glutaredoxin family protein